jgi:hypothetical protein
LVDDNARPITYTTKETAPNRVFTVQWRQARRFAIAGQFNFQIKLYETTNVISIVYGNCAPTGNNANAINVQVGLHNGRSFFQLNYMDIFINLSGLKSNQYALKHLVNEFLTFYH